MTKALGHLRDMAALLLLVAIMLFTFSLIIPVKETAGFISLIGMFVGVLGIALACVHIWFAERVIDRS